MIDYEPHQEGKKIKANFSRRVYSGRVHPAQSSMGEDWGSIEGKTTPDPSVKQLHFGILLFSRQWL